MAVKARHHGGKYSRFNVIADGILCLLPGADFLLLFAGTNAGLAPTMVAMRHSLRAAARCETLLSLCRVFWQFDGG